MPIKIPKSFVRRKSSGNALEEVPNAPAPSFRVIERRPGGKQSWDGINDLKQQSQVRMDEATENDFDEELFPDKKDDSSNRGSGGTNNSASTAPYGSAASSARLSSSSTIPSSTDISNDSHTNSIVSTQRPFQDIPVPPTARSRGWSIRNAGRTFSFASKQKIEVPVEPLPLRRPSPPVTQTPTFTPGRRERAMTASTASTATPPKLLDGELGFGDSGLENFENIFDGIGNQTSRDSVSPHHSAKMDLPPLPYGADSAVSQQISPLPSSLDIDRARVEASSPYSFGSQDSRDGLMGSPIAAQSQNPSSPVRRKALPPLQGMPNRSPLSSPVREADTNTGSLSGTSHVKSPSPAEDESARLLASSMSRRDSSLQQIAHFGAARKLEPANRNGMNEDNDDNDELLFSTPSPNRPDISRTAPRKAAPPSSFRQPNAGTVDSSLIDSFRVAARFEADAPAQEKPAKKVMTPAQFERYRQQQEQTRRKNNLSQKDDSGDENDNYDDDDELERDRQAAQQRRKQEAHLSVYRQTMMKVTGESSAGPISNAAPSVRLTSLSTPELSRMSHLTAVTGVSSHSGKSSGTDEEDEDVPLGILAAHGFPNKNKPPSRLQTSVSNSSLPGSTPLSAPPASVSGESRGGPKGNLPVFARNLPQDPYYGASLVNASNREQLPMGGGLGGAPAGQVHPNGLVGVIAGEERARAMRRGSPNPQAMQDSFMPAQHPGMMGRSQTMGAVPPMSGYPGPGMAGMMGPQALSPGDQAQIQMAQHMSQMMQMQMQWMQQMTQMQHNGQMGQMPQPPQHGMPAMPNLIGMSGEMGNASPRPYSMPLPDSARQNGRTMSLTPGSSNQWNRNSSYSPSVAGVPGGYAPSIAPSERNTIGMASRYRPVSIIAESIKAPNDNRLSTFTSGTFQPWSHQNTERGRLSPSNTNITVRPPSTSGLGRKPLTPDEEDDDQGWAEMKKKRDNKKGIWKMKRSEKSGG
ncbi:hypothetical protein GJ744_005784 [Endocarpon pusillum]|uniref:Uncharacterized protein n=1 Tax=Endocarpon pusillum TaxID=364733 RepID=A0A8H7E584_9EURO|nr:hypothetical protein GJ744_005784 [Endocarpon pusillum]